MGKCGTHFYAIIRDIFCSWFTLCRMSKYAILLLATALTSKWNSFLRLQIKPDVEKLMIFAALFPLFTFFVDISSNAFSVHNNAWMLTWQMYKPTWPFEWYWGVLLCTITQQVLHLAYLNKSDLQHYMGMKTWPQNWHYT